MWAAGAWLPPRTWELRCTVGGSPTRPATLLTSPTPMASLVGRAGSAPCRTLNVRQTPLQGAAGRLQPQASFRLSGPGLAPLPAPSVWEPLTIATHHLQGADAGLAILLVGLLVLAVLLGGVVQHRPALHHNSRRPRRLSSQGGRAREQGLRVSEGDRLWDRLREVTPSLYLQPP